MIAILGGTFDPIHFGHLRPALEIVEKLSLSELRFIPSAKPPHRWLPQATAEDRLKMVEIAIKTYPKFVLDDCEYKRLKEKNLVSFTIDTVQTIRQEIGEKEPLGMIVGTDAFQSFTQWRDWEKILETVHLIVASRPGYKEQKFSKQKHIDHSLKHEDSQHVEDSNEWIIERLETEASKLHESPSGKVYFCDVTQLDISATFIRNQLDEGKSCRYLSPKKVLKYINKKALYGNWS